MLSRAEEIANIKAELELGTMTLEAAIKSLHPDASEDVISELIESGVGINNLLVGMGDKGDLEPNPITEKITMPGSKENKMA
jgi:hypothetical protein